MVPDWQSGHYCCLNQGCQMGAWLSMVGVVTGTRLGASHAIGHILGGTAGVPHGYTSCVMLPFVMDFNDWTADSFSLERIDERPGDDVSRFGSCRTCDHQDEQK